MRSTKPPARADKPKHPLTKRASLRPARAPAVLTEIDVESRVAACEAVASRARQDVATLTNELATARKEIALLRGEVTEMALRLRRMPPPLPDDNDEVMSVDEREVVLESLRPPVSSGRGGTRPPRR